MADEADLAQTWDWTERQNVLAYLVCESFSHFMDASFCVFLVALGKHNNCIWVLQWNLIPEQAHVTVVALETVDHDEQVHSNEASVNLGLVRSAAFNDPLLGDLLTASDHVDELGILVNSVAFFEDYWSQSNVGFIQTTSSNFEKTNSIFEFFILLLNFKFLPFGLCKFLVCVSNILVFILWQQGKITSWNYLSENTLTPSFPCLLFVFHL